MYTRVLKGVARRRPAAGGEIESGLAAPEQHRLGAGGVIHDVGRCHGPRALLRVRTQLVSVQHHGGDRAREDECADSDARDDDRAWRRLQARGQRSSAVAPSSRDRGEDPPTQRHPGSLRGRAGRSRSREPFEWQREDRTRRTASSAQAGAAQAHSRPQPSAIAKGTARVGRGRPQLGQGMTSESYDC